MVGTGSTAGRPRNPRAGIDAVMAGEVARVGSLRVGLDALQRAHG
jgi:hypothetical protein